MKGAWLSFTIFLKEYLILSMRCLLGGVRIRTFKTGVRRGLGVVIKTGTFLKANFIFVLEVTTWITGMPGNHLMIFRSQFCVATRMVATGGHVAAMLLIVRD